MANRVEKAISDLQKEQGGTHSNPQPPNMPKGQGRALDHEPPDNGEIPWIFDDDYGDESESDVV